MTLLQPWPIPYRMIVDHVHDGDTIMGTIVADAGLKIGIELRDWSLRFYGFDAEEVNDPDPVRRTKGLAARDYLRTLVSPGDTLSVLSYDFDKYGKRLDGTPRTAAGTDLVAAMVAGGWQKAPR